MEDQGDAGIGGLLAPSPQSEAVTHEMGELSLHPTQKLPPLNERKNGTFLILTKYLGSKEWDLGTYSVTPS